MTMAVSVGEALKMKGKEGEWSEAEHEVKAENRADHMHAPERASMLIQLLTRPERALTVEKGKEAEASVSCAPFPVRQEAGPRPERQGASTHHIVCRMQRTRQHQHLAFIHMSRACAFLSVE